MRPQPVESASDIEKIARVLLKDSKAFGKFPTPVDQITRYTEIQIANGVDLSKVEPSFFSKKFDIFNSAMRKILGIIDIRHKTVYLDLSQNPSRQNFIKLHEVGHDALPWQKESLMYAEDERTLNPLATEIFEREANYFASCALFQLERFDEEADKLPLSLNSAMLLSRKIGSSVQAAVRRYVEYSRKRCAVLVLEKPSQNRTFKAKIRNYFESPSFKIEFSDLIWPEECGEEFQFILDLKTKRKFHENGVLNVTRADLQSMTLTYHYFNNGYNAFVFLIPPGEKNHSRTKIIVNS